MNNQSSVMFDNILQGEENKDDPINDIRAYGSDYKYLRKKECNFYNGKDCNSS